MNRLRRSHSAPSNLQSGFLINITSPPHPQVAPFFSPQPNPHDASSSSSHQVEVSIDHSSPLESTSSSGQFRAVEERIDLLCKTMVLYQAALKGEWQEAESLFNNYPHLIRESITGDNETVLHIAAGAKNTAFVEKLVHLMTPDDMAIPNKHGNTPLCFAAASGVVRIAKIMVEKNTQLPLIRGFDDATPLLIAICYKHREMVDYLFPKSEILQLTSKGQIELLIAAIHNDFYDVGLEILKKSNSDIATTKDGNNETALHVMARKPSAIGSKKQLNLWEKYIDFSLSNLGIKGTYSKDVTKTLHARELVDLLWQQVLQKLPQQSLLEFIKQPMHDAARAGNVEFLIRIISAYPDIAWECDDGDKNIFHIAVENRLENVFNLIHEVVGLKEFSSKFKLVVNGKYNMLHLAAKLAAQNHLNRVSGAALQMQRELLWFKEVEKVVLSSQLEAKCVDQLTPRELFTKEHKDLRKEGEKWMRNTANSCMLVATLIATIVFAAAFTIPGGSNNNTGIPIFQRNLWFTVFVIMDAGALVSSSISILLFMSILTSRYAEDDFLHSLPSKLLFGLASLFISIMCMVMAFSATFFMLYHEANIHIPTIIAIVAIVLVSSFCVLQFKLWIDIFCNTYLSRFLFECGPRKLFSTSHPIDLYNELRKIKKY